MADGTREKVLNWTPDDWRQRGDFLSIDPHHEPRPLSWFAAYVGRRWYYAAILVAASGAPGDDTIVRVLGRGRVLR